MKEEKVINLLSYYFKTYYQVILMIFFGALFSLYYNNYRLGINDHIIYLPYLEYIKNGTFANDDILKIFNGRASFFFLYFGWLYKIFNLSTATLLLQFCAIFAYYLSIYSIAKIFIKNKYITLFVLLFFLESKATFGFITDFDYSHFLVRNLATPLLLFSIAFALRRKLTIAMILSGIGFSLHVISGLHFFILYGVYLIYNSLRTKSINKLHYIVYALAHFPILIYKFIFAKSVYHLPIFTIDYTYFDMQKSVLASFLDVNSYHYLISLEFGLAFAVIGVYAMYKVLKGDHIHNHEDKLYIKNVLLYIVIYTISLFIVNHLFLTYLPLALVLQLQLIRFTKFLLILNSIFLAVFIIKRYNPKDIFWWIFAIAALFGLQHVFLLTIFLLYISLRKLKNNALTYLFAVLVILAGFANGYFGKIYNMTISKHMGIEANYNRKYKNIYDYFQTLDSKDVLILTTPSLPGNEDLDPRLEFNRPVYFTFAEIVESSINYGLDFEVKQKIKDLKLDLQAFIKNGGDVYDKGFYNEGLMSLIEDDLRMLAQKRGITHIVTSKTHLLNFQKIIEEDNLIVYKIN